MKNKKLKILFVSSEVFPFAKTGGLADVSRSLPKALSTLGHDVRVIMPFYRCVSEGNFETTKAAENLFLNRSDGLLTYFVENRRYFARGALYGTAICGYPDNAFRFGFFSKAALDGIKILQFKPDIIHCNDWQSGLVPFYLRFTFTGDKYYSGIKTLFTIHNMAYQGIFSKVFARWFLGIPRSNFKMSGLEFRGKINFMKAGIVFADAINTVSRRYTKEIMTPEYGYGLEEVLRMRENDLFGIPNGVDYAEWGPEKDGFIAVNYSSGSIENKKTCKKDLLRYTGLPVSMDRPLMGCVTRLVHQKGVDLLAGIMDKLVEMNVGVVILGRGESRYNRLFVYLARKYPANVSLCQAFNDELAHKIEAGCDMFLMPSRYEPCGLNQMYSIKYGTIPVVRATGGLDDVIVDFDENREKGNGFKFKSASKDALLEAVKRAISCYANKELWNKLMLQAMSYDHSWEHSAREYVELYERMLRKKPETRVQKPEG